MDKNKTASKLIYCNQKQRKRKEPQEAVVTIPETS